MTTLAAKNPDVFIAMLTGDPCAQAITEAAQNGMKEDGQVPVHLVGVQERHVRRQAKAVGDAVQRLVGHRRRRARPRSPAEDTVAVSSWAARAADGGGLRLQVSGILRRRAWHSAGAVPQVCMVAGRSRRPHPGQLVTALRAMDMTNPATSRASRRTSTATRTPTGSRAPSSRKYDSANQGFVQQGDIIELSGKSKPCAWDQATSTCK